MASGKSTASYETLTALTKSAIAQALFRHRRLGQSIAVWQDGKVAILDAEQIPPQPESQCELFIAAPSASRHGTEGIGMEL